MCVLMMSKGGGYVNRSMRKHGDPSTFVRVLEFFNKFLWVTDN